MSPAVRPARLRRAAAVSLLALAGLATAVPAAGAVTVTPLGKCTAPKPPYPNLERLTVPGTVKVGTDGRPSGASVGISVRNFTMPYNGSAVDLGLNIFDVSTGKQAGFLGALSWGCERYLWSLRADASSPTGVVGGMKLQRGKIYAVRASAAFIDTSGMDPTYGLGGLFAFPVAYFVAI